MISVYEERGIEKGIAQGKREMLLRMMLAKFGNVPNDIRQKVEAIKSPDLLDTLSERILTVGSLEEMKIEAQ